MNVILDSGAFSAFKQKKEVNIQDYIDFILKNRHMLTFYANLDVIGDSEKTWQNQKMMESAGLSPLPVFHMNEDLLYLDRCMKYEYFALGGMVAKSVSTEKKRSFLDVCFSRICDKEGLPTRKVHGFGMTVPSLIARYPFYSCDSTSWAIYGKYGIILFAKITEGRADYTKQPFTVKISTRSPSQIHADKHLSTMSESDREYLISIIEEKGFTIGASRFENGKEVVEKEGLSNSGKLRDRWNMMFFLEMEKSIPPWPWAFKVEKNKYSGAFDF